MADETPYTWLCSHGEGSDTSLVRDVSAFHDDKSTFDMHHDECSFEASLNEFTCSQQKCAGNRLPLAVSVLYDGCDDEGG